MAGVTLTSDWRDDQGSGGKDNDHDNHEEEHARLNTYLDDAADGFDRLGCGVRVLDRLILEVEIDDVVGVVSDVRLISGHPQLGDAPGDLRKGLELAERVLVAELNNLHGHGELGAAQPFDEL